MNKNQKIYIRAKREKSIYFFECHNYENIDAIKKRISIFYKDAVDSRLYLGTRLLDEKSNIHDQGVRNDSLIHFKLKKSNGQWEQISELGI